MGKTLVKVAAVASSLILVVGLVSYRAGAFDALMRPVQPSAESASDSAADDSAMIYSTKSGPMLLEASPPGPAERAAVMGGSKSRAVFDPPPAPVAPPQDLNTAGEYQATQPAQPPTNNGAPPVGSTKNTERTVIMSTSKSIVLEFTPPQRVEEIVNSLPPGELDTQPAAPANPPETKP